MALKIRTLMNPSGMLHDVKYNKKQNQKVMDLRWKKHGWIMLLVVIAHRASF